MPSKQLSYIYGLRALGTNEIRYVGKTHSDYLARRRGHIKSAKLRKTPVAQWVADLGEAPEIHVLEQGVFAPWQLDALEREWIRYGRTLGWPLLNQTIGGGGTTGFHWNEASRIRFSEAQMNHPVSDETREKESKAAKKRAAALRAERGYVVDPEHLAKMAAGRKYDDEWRAKVSAGLVGREMTPEWCEKIAAAHRGQKRTPQHCAAIAAAHERISADPEKAAAREACLRLGRTPETAELGRHARWHVNRGLVNPACRLCCALPDFAELLAAQIARLPAPAPKTPSGKTKPSYTPEVKEDQRQRGLLSMHTRWHVNRGIVNPDCALCTAENLIP